jgi:hypothetical protein
LFSQYQFFRGTFYPGVALLAFLPICAPINSTEMGEYPSLLTTSEAVKTKFGSIYFFSDIIGFCSEK